MTSYTEDTIKDMMLAGVGDYEIRRKTRMIFSPGNPMK